MKVLHISTAASWRGGEQQLLYLVEGLLSMGVRQSVITPQGSELSRRLFGKEVEVLVYRQRFSLAATVARSARECGCDLVHVHDSHAHTAAVTAAAFFGMHTPIVLSRRVDFPVSNSFLSRWKYNHSSIRSIICVSGAVGDVLRPDIRDASKITVIHDGVNVEEPASDDHAGLKSELGLGPQTRLVGNVSALADHKDHPTFLRTAAFLVARRSDVHFVLAGAGPEETAIRNLVDALGLQKHVHLLGFRKDPKRIIASLDVFLMTSKTEGLGSVVMDAFAVGTPVVATSAGGLPELVENGKTGFLVPVGDHEALAAAVVRLLDERSLRESIVENARTKVASMTFMTMSEKTLGVYRKVLDGISRISAG